MLDQEMYNCPKTIVSEEYSTEFKDDMELYCPVNNECNNCPCQLIPCVSSSRKECYLWWSFS